MNIDESNTLPDQAIIPNIVVRGVEEAIQFYQNAFGAEILNRGAAAGSIRYAKLRIGRCSLIVSGEDAPDAEMHTGSPNKFGGTSATFELLVDDLDNALARALKAGASELNAPLRGTYVGDQAFSIVDPFGHVWVLSTFLDDGGALCI